jgi:hypothetical protein
VAGLLTSDDGTTRERARAVVTRCSGMAWDDGKRGSAEALVRGGSTPIGAPPSGSMRSATQEKKRRRGGGGSFGQESFVIIRLPTLAMATIPP